MENKNQNLTEARRLLESIENNIFQLKKLIFADAIDNKKKISQQDIKDVVEGVFDGEQMVGDDNKNYPVSPNYASKSKLISGDRLKLTITRDGSFIFKQIEPAERAKKIGRLTETLTGQYQVVADEKKYNVLLSAVTFYQAQPGDRLTIVIPKTRESLWAAIDNKLPYMV